MCGAPPRFGAKRTWKYQIGLDWLTGPSAGRLRDTLGSAAPDVQARSRAVSLSRSASTRRASNLKQKSMSPQVRNSSPFDCSNHVSRKLEQVWGLEIYIILIKLCETNSVCKLLEEADTLCKGQFEGGKEEA